MKPYINYLIYISLLFHGCSKFELMSSQNIHCSTEMEREFNLDTNSFEYCQNKFSFKVLENQHETLLNNIILSPYSLYSTIFTLYYCSNNKDRDILSRQLNLDTAFNYINHINSANNNLQKTDKTSVKIKTSCALWINKGIEKNDDFLENLSKYFLTEIHYTDFINNPTQSIGNINSWISNKTDNYIPKIISHKDISAKTKAVLTNSLLFDAEWKYKFQKSNTKKNLFYNYFGENDTVFFMTQSNNLNYFENEDLKMVELPYLGENYSLLVILPNTFNKDNSINYLDIFNSYRKESLNIKQHMVNVFLPKIEMESDYNLAEIISNIGGEDISKISLDRIFSKEKIHIDQIRQKNKLILNEERSIFVSSTLSSMSSLSNLSTDISFKEFRADKPFLFILRSKKDNIILFIGQVIKI